mgnify:CR=1 FL=1
MGCWFVTGWSLGVGLADRILRKVYARRRAKLRDKHSMCVAADFVRVCVKLEWCDQHEALEIKKRLEWLHNMSRYK